MTIKEWCEENNISRHKYNYWNHKILTRKELSVEEVEFTEITPILSECDNLLSNLNKSNDFHILYKDVQVTIPSNFNQNSLAGLMKVLQEL
ncbi:IS66 family insertion sequence element accessory protein TnpA [Clostridium butyricum]|uniref:IS66 family insertion sequence element accessory protein TnpA n=1 Tax=Clostridium butyricum TaxID=1492 RepID=UPI00374F6061